MPSQQVKITIITVCYNAANEIEKTIQSVLSQDYPNLEYIVKDGNSRDHTPSIIEKYINKIDHYLVGQDRGIYDAMNIAVIVHKQQQVHGRAPTTRFFI